MKKVIMSIIALAVISMTIGFVACNKEKDTINENQNQNENVERKPIATLDKNTGKMTYHLTVEMLQNNLGKNSFVKDANQFVVESFEIVSSESKDSKKEGIQLSLLDTDAEKSYTTRFNSEFLEKKTTDNNVSYYFAEDFESGDFSFFNREKNGTYKITLQNFEVVNVEEVPDSTICYLPSAKVTVTCQGQGCYQGGCVVYYDSSGNPVGCTQCVGQGDNVYCIQTITSSSGGIWEDIAEWLKLAVGVWGFLK